MTLPTPVALPISRFDGPAGTPLVIAHGLFGQGRNFASIAKRLAERRPVATLDMRNHGDAPHDDAMTYPAMAADLAAAIAAVGAPAVLLGHSMGGKAAMALALSRPDLLAGLVVADIAPVAYDHQEHGSIVAAMRALDLAAIDRRSTAERALAAAISNPGIRAFIVQNLAVGGGAARWRPNLPVIEASMPAILGFPADLPEPAFEGPTLFLHGGASDYVTPACHGRIRALFPDAEITALAGAGHWLHAEQPGPFVETLETWLATL
ncbi:MAG: alpha/beta fold hydrolase [Pseudomonadota bacterium]